MKRIHKPVFLVFSVLCKLTFIKCYSFSVITACHTKSIHFTLHTQHTHTHTHTIPYTTVLLYQESEVVSPQFNLQAVVSYSSLVECVDEHWILLGCPDMPQV